ncbi:hypothetical protein IMCC1989_2380 [gamma proteobacterium IMCC1989]|nr:hypothetical protein IMCC1989_2380 [gamma proteobacterium IMCC1989]
MAVKKITFVKKIFADGSPCKKCGEVMEKMEAANQMRFIDEVVVADEADADSLGMLLAKQYDVSKAPFFIVEQVDGQVDVYTIYFKLVKDVLNHL